MIKFQDRVMQKFFLWCVFSCLLSQSMNATFIDNRFFPFFPENYKRTYQRRSTIDSNFFMMIAHDARGNDEKSVGLFEIFGEYNLLKIAASLQATGRPNPLKPEWQKANEILYDFSGKLDTQGFWFATEFALVKDFCKSLSVGTRFAFMHANLRQKFILSQKTQNDLHLQDGGKLELDRERRESSALLGLTGENWSATGPTDLDIYVRLGKMRDYIYKCKFFDMGASLGLLIPTGQQRDINNAASYPFSSGGFMSMYLLGDLTVELKEDWFVGGWADFVFRLPKTQQLRMPYGEEPFEFGAVTGKFRVDPGFTFGWSIFMKILDFNNGLGGKIKYTMIKHTEDDIYAFRSNQFLANLAKVSKDSSWMSEYITVELLYQINQAESCKQYDPYVYINFDAPIHGFGQERVAKTFKLSVGLEVNF